MEMIKTTGFCEMSADEMQKTDGGLDPVGLFGLMLALGYAVGKITKYSLDEIRWVDYE